MKSIPKSEEIQLFYKKVVETPDTQANSLLSILGPMNVKLENPFKLIDLI